MSVHVISCLKRTARNRWYSTSTAPHVWCARGRGLILRLDLTKDIKKCTWCFLASHSALKGQTKEAGPVFLQLSVKCDHVGTRNEHDKWHCNDMTEITLALMVY